MRFSLCPPLLNLSVAEWAPATFVFAAEVQIPKAPARLRSLLPPMTSFNG